MQKLSVFDFDHPVEYLKQVYNERYEQNRQYSLRSFSKQLGLSSPSTLSSVFNGTRRFTDSLARKISRPLGMNREESRYLELLCQYNTEKDAQTKAELVDEIQNLRPDIAFQSYSADIFNTISSWYHFAILAAGSVQKFNLDITQLHKYFRPQISAGEVQAAVERMERLGFVKKGKINFSTYDKISFGDEVPNQAVRDFHKQALKLAEAAIEEQKMEERDLRASTFGIANEDYPEALRIIKKCHQDLLKLESKKADHIYQLNSQFFSLTKDNDREKDNEQ